ncbi:sulfotransferase [Cognatiyoonia sp. IB215182]|uniref:sulfotransferase n=1 Tax=Cognatiyoonia sp. IB215182 TaxID=3097353 RepID=UPI002A0E0CA7|nr:sulfotransferase [Cognatiyoonia sp. IB215182]MDX8353108.1 sulfotransferase [Cognatiyoonia sp. IB215182]
MPKAPLVHIGYQKTASTFLQRRVFSDEAVFVRPWGRHAAQAIEHFVLEHPEHFDPAKVRAVFGQFEDQIPVISQEDLSGIPVYAFYHAETVAQRVKEAFPDARILVCVREQKSMIVSQYFQFVRQGGSRSLLSMLEDNDSKVGFRPVIRKEHFEYDLMYNLLRRYFDADRILMLPHELLRRDPETYFAKLNTLLGTSLPSSLATETVNAKRSGSAAQVERFFNKMFPMPPDLPKDYKDYPLWVRARNRLMRNIDQFATRYTNLGQSFEDKIKREAAGYIGDHFAASNTRLSKLLDIDLAALGYPTLTGTD